MSSCDNSPERTQRVKTRRCRRPNRKAKTAKTVTTAPNSSSLLLGGRSSIAARIRHLENPALSRFFDAAKKVQSTSRITRDIAVSEEGSTSDSGSSDDDAGATDVKTLTAQGDLPQDFWQIQKLVRYLKIGNQGRREMQILQKMALSF